MRPVRHLAGTVPVPGEALRFVLSSKWQPFASFLSFTVQNCVFFLKPSAFAVPSQAWTVLVWESAPLYRRLLAGGGTSPASASSAFALQGSRCHRSSVVWRWCRGWLRGSQCKRRPLAARKHRIGALAAAFRLPRTLCQSCIVIFLQL